MNWICYIAGILGGIFLGWTLRSIQFGIDRDCANPDHKDLSRPTDNNEDES